MLHALDYSYRHRRERKSDFRKLWITRINAATRARGLNYSEFMAGLRRSSVQIDRKMLAEMAAKDPEGFATLVDSVTEISSPRL
jgi:large subunit ribosomal protein L20